MSNINENKSTSGEQKYIETEPEQIKEAEILAGKIAKILDDKKAGNIKIIGVNQQTIIADFFVIATGTSSTHIRSLAGEVEFQLKEKENIVPARIDGVNNNDWIIIDYNSVILHIFNNESRDYYKLEKLWGDGEIIDYDTLLNNLNG